MDKVLKYCVLNLTLILIHSNIKNKIFLLKVQEETGGRDQHDSKAPILMLHVQIRRIEAKQQLIHVKTNTTVKCLC